MASLPRPSKTGARRILFVSPDGERKTIYLGKLPQKAAETIQAKVEELLACKAAGMAWPVELASWVGDAGDTLADKLVSVGLIPPRCRSTLGGFLDDFLAKRATAKPNSIKAYKQTAAKLLAFFGREIDLRALTPSMAEEYQASLAANHAKATAGRHVKFARQFFHLAMRHKLVTENPFANVKVHAQSNEARKFFVTREVCQQVLDACPDAEWRLLFALCRYGGLRCPSEIAALKWADVNWAKGRLLVHAPKTEHHEGGGERLVPIFPELRQYLADAFDLAEPGDVYVIQRYRELDANLRNQLLRILAKAGLTPWERLFQNLRASRETELASEFPIHVACKWIGNSARVAAKHYLQITEADFVRASGPEKSSAFRNTLSAQNATQQADAVSCEESQIVPCLPAGIELISKNTGNSGGEPCLLEYRTGIHLDDYLQQFLAKVAGA